MIGARLYRHLPGDPKIWLVWFALALASILAVYSSSGSLAYKAYGGNTERFLIKQMVFVGLGFFITWWCARNDYKEYSRWAPILLVGTVPLLIYTIFWGLEINDARRWIAIPLIGQTFQTSDFAKIALIMYVARVITIKQDVIKNLRRAFLPIILPVVVVCALIAPADLSTAAMLFLTCTLMMIAGRIRLKYIAIMILCGIGVLAMLFALGALFPDFIRSDTWMVRINSFFYGEDTIYQVQQAKIAIAEGGFTGVGPGNSTQRNFLPSAYADFIYAIICEEWGLIGAFVVIACYTWLLYCCVVLVTRFNRAFGAMLALGMAFYIVIQAYMNIAVSVDLVPVTGLTLPMISMGGTSLLFTCAALGMILSVSRHYYIEQRKMATDTP